jgi:hypothetical protein
MGSPTQSTGQAAESLSAAATAGFLGWSPDSDRTPYTLRNGSDGSATTAYTTLTAYAVGKTVTSGGLTYVVRTAVGAGNSTPPASNSNFLLIDNHKGASEAPDAVSRIKQFYR